MPRNTRAFSVPRLNCTFARECFADEDVPRATNLCSPFVASSKIECSRNFPVRSILCCIFVSFKRSYNIPETNCSPSTFWYFVNTRTFLFSCLMEEASVPIVLLERRTYMHGCWLNWKGSWAFDKRNVPQKWRRSFGMCGKKYANEEIVEEESASFKVAWRKIPGLARYSRQPVLIFATIFV